MDKKSLVLVVCVFAVAALVLVGPSAWRILSGHQYEANEFWLPSDESNQSRIDHGLWQSVLEEFLITDDPSGINLVDYESLQDEGRDLLNDYINQIAEIDVRHYSRAEQFAYWVNLYNALTLQVVIDHWPVASIKEISGSAVLPGPWDDELVILQDQPLTLNDIEHRILRPIWQDLRIHFAVNCASIGCPNLQGDAFTSDNSEALLELSARQFLQHPRGLGWDEGELVLSSIFDWYQSDFGQNENQMLAALSPYLKNDDRKRLKDHSAAARYQYDWSLNEFR